MAIDFLDSYLATEVRGLWMDQFDEAGRGMTDAAPASTLYHVVVAFRELMLFAANDGDGDGATVPLNEAP